MRTLAGLSLLACALLAACSGGTVSGADAGCAALFDWNGMRYQGAGFRLPPELGERLGEGTYPGCDDGGGPVSEQHVQGSSRAAPAGTSPWRSTKPMRPAGRTGGC